MNLFTNPRAWVGCFLFFAGFIQAQDFTSVSFGGVTDYVSTSWDPAFATDQDFAIDFSIRSEGWSSDPAVLSDKDWGSGSNPGFNIALAGDGTGIDVNVGDGSERADLQAGSINDGQWHHVLVSFDRDDALSMWIDGALVQSTDMSNVGDISSPFSFNIGQDGTGTYGSGTTAALTNLRVWNTTLSFEDIEDVACGEVTPGHPFFANLLHYWAMQEGAGTTAADLIGGADGTLEGNTTWLDGFFPSLDPSFDFEVELSTVDFFNTSIDATSFFWEFGDNNTSTLENPTHTYLATGTYTISLTVGNACESVVLTEEITIDELNTNLKQSVDFDGDDDVISLTNDVTFTGNDFTIELLVRSEGWSADPGIISNKNWNSGSNPGFIVAAQSNGVEWKFNIGDGSERIDLDGGVINDGLWHHIAVVYDHDGMKQVWHDGELFEETDEILPGNIDTALPLHLGRDGNGNWPFTGNVAEVRIWGVALDSTTLADFKCEPGLDHPNAADLLNYWKLDEGNGTVINDSAGDNEGTYNGDWTTTLFTVDCGGESTDFNAAQLASTSREDYITTTFDPTFGTDEDFSIDFRIRSFGWDGDPAIVSDKDWNSGNNAGFVFAFNGNSIKVNAGSGSNRADVNGSLAMNDGQWHHVLATFDRDGDLELFLDGISQGTDVMGGDVLDMNSAFPMNIGQDGTGDYPIGFSTTGPTSEIAFVRVWDRVVSLAEVDACSQFDETDPLWEDLLHYWKLDEGTGTFAEDSKGDANGTWVNTEAWTFFNDYQAASADFDAVVNLSSVSFINNSTSGSYTWMFGDGEMSNATSPSHLYFETGSFEVTLIVEGNCTSDTLTQMVEVQELDPNLLTSLDFDGDDDLVILENDLAFGNTGDFTMELYVRSGGWAADPGILSNKDWNSGGNPGFIIAGKTDNTTWKFNIGDGDERIDIDGGVINDQQWHHLVVIYDQDGVKQLWQDGVMVGESTDVIPGNVDTALDLIIGADGNGNFKFTGQVAEVRIWDTVIDETTLADYLCGVDNTHPNFTNLLHYWKGDEGMGTSVNDDISGNAGTYNGAWTVTSNTIQQCLSFAPVNDIGSGNAVRFDALDDWIDCSGADGNKVPASSLNLPEESITLECWVNPTTYTIWHSMVAFIQDNGSFEKGWDLETRDDKKFAFALSTTGNTSLTYLETTNSFDENTWYHVAGVYDGTEQKIYVNGVLEATATSQSGPIDYADSWLAIAMYKDDNENFSFDGVIDEVRIWNVARTAEEIQADMCQKLAGDEPGLVAYYRLDNIAGEEVRDYGPNELTGLMQDMEAASTREISGAAIGDESVQVYTNTWDGQELTLTSTENGDVTLSNLEGLFLEGAHLYRVDELPNTTAGIFDLGDNNTYYGTFLADRTNTTSHDLTYDYSTYPNAVDNEASLTLYNRASNAIENWFTAGPSSDPASDQLNLENVGSRREIILADFTASPCVAPSNIVIDDAGFEEATLSWTGNGTAYNIEWGPTGFVFGAGTLIENNVGESITISGLSAATVYDLYLQTDCGGGLLSSWTGPITFATSDPCQVPFDVEIVEVTASTMTVEFDAVATVSAFDLQWGTANFPIGNGITVSSMEKSFTLDFLPANTDLEFYLRSNCSADFGVISEWVGPFAFTTDMIDGVDDYKELTYFQVFPNPTVDHLQVQIMAEQSLEEATLTVFNTLGQEIWSQDLESAAAIQTSLDVQSWQNGTYFMQIRSQQTTAVTSFTVQH